LQVVSGGLDKRAVVWNTSTYMPQTIFNGHTTGIESLAWASDGQTIGSSSLGGVVRIWNAGDGQQVHGFFMDAQLPMRAVSFASTGGQLAVGGDDGIVRFWNGLVCGQQVQVNFGTQCLDVPQRLHAHEGRVRTLAWSPDARLLATGGDDGVLAIWYPGQRQAPLLKVKQNGPVLALSWSPTGREVATASGSTVTIWGLS
jgi:WD40 repeat protein